MTVQHHSGSPVEPPRVGTGECLTHAKCMCTGHVSSSYKRLGAAASWWHGGRNRTSFTWNNCYLIQFTFNKKNLMNIKQSCESWSRIRDAGSSAFLACFRDGKIWIRDEHLRSYFWELGNNFWFKILKFFFNSVLLVPFLTPGFEIWDKKLGFRIWENQ